MDQVTRGRACAAALAVAPAFPLLAHAVQVTPDDHATAAELAVIAAHPGRYDVALVLGFVGLVLMVPGALGLARPLWTTRPRWALAGLALTVPGLLALTALMGSGPVAAAMARTGPRASMVAATDAYESSAVFTLWVLLMVVGYSLGPIVLGTGLWRAGASWAVPVLLGGGLVMAMADAGRAALALGFGLTWAGAALAAVHVWRTAGSSVAATPDSGPYEEAGSGRAR